MSSFDHRENVNVRCMVLEGYGMELAYKGAIGRYEGLLCLDSEIPQRVVIGEAGRVSRLTKKEKMRVGFTGMTRLS